MYLDGFSHAELKHWNQLSHPEKWSWEAEAVHEAWGPLGSPVPDGESNRQRIGAGDPWGVDLMATLV